jgi:uncharacterized membrane protein YGL010W
MKNGYKWGVPLTLQAISGAVLLGGHYIVERKPLSIVENTVEIYTYAPLIVFLDALFAFGYRPCLLKKLNEKLKIVASRLKLRRDRNL